MVATQGIPPATAPCVSCHGVGLRGTPIAPLIAGRSASYLLRQLIAFSVSSRADSAAAPMRALAGTLSLDNMIAVAAYVASLNPN
jgi:cytochrome c553